MAANIFVIENERLVHSSEIFYKKINLYRKILFMPDELVSTKEMKISFKNKYFDEVSFSKTIIKNVKFFNCTFNKCLFLNTTFDNCTFSNCKFFDSNTLGSKWINNTSIDSKSFQSNFDFKNDANIAVKLFVELMKLYKENDQIDREKDARYLYLKSTHSLYHYHYKIKEDISLAGFFTRKFNAWFLDKLSGYGVYKLRLLRALSIFLIFISFINYFFQSDLFEIKNRENTDYITNPNFSELFSYLIVFDSNKIFYDIIDIIYFSFITITTIGYGDISPSTTIGQIVIMTESIIGIILIALSLNMFTNGK